MPDHPKIEPTLTPSKPLTIKRGLADGSISAATMASVCGKPTLFMTDEGTPIIMVLGVPMPHNVFFGYVIANLSKRNENYYGYDEPRLRWLLDNIKIPLKYKSSPNPFFAANSAVEEWLADVRLSSADPRQGVRDALKSIHEEYVTVCERFEEASKARVAEASDQTVSN